MTPDLGLWLRLHGLEQYEQLFLENQVDFATLQVLTEADLQELGLPFGPRKRLRNALVGAAAAPVSPAPQDSGERRQLTVLFCDMAGFSELASRLDPELLRAVIRQYEDTCAVGITRYEGYVFQRLGDGIVAFFGYPLAHEGEADRAIRAGLEIVEAFRTLDVPGAGRLHVRIGIAAGMVVVESAARGAVGETMNLASRLQGLAPLDSVVVSERVHQVAGDSFDYQDLGPQLLKGITKPNRVWRVQGVSSAPLRFDAGLSELGPMVGRDAELALLRENWRECRHGLGHAVLLSGEPGIGKSRILTAIRSDLEATGTVALRFRCSPYHLNSPFHPIAVHLERALGFTPGEDPESKLEKLAAWAFGHFGRPTEDLRLLAALLSLPGEARFGEFTLPPRRRMRGTVEALVGLIETDALSRSCALLFEDLHWADPSTLEVLAELVGRLGHMPLLAVLTARPEFAPPWAAGAGVTVCNLSRLTPAQSAALILRVTGGKALPAELEAQIIERTDGVPLFVEELTRASLESGELVDNGTCFVRAPGARPDTTLPATLRDALMARLDRLGSAREIAQVGAAIGREFSFQLMAAISSLPGPELEANLVRLTSSGLVFGKGTPPNALYAFKHALVQDTAYDSMLRSRRRDLHGEIARVLQTDFPDVRRTSPELLAHHYSAAGLPLAALPFWKKAGESALRRFALREAVAHLETGLASARELPAGAERDVRELEMRTLLGPSVVALRGWGLPEVAEILEPAWKLAEALGQRECYLPVLHSIWVHHLCLGELEVSLHWAQKLLDIGKALGDDDMVVTGHRAAGASYYWMGNFLSAARHGELLREVYDPVRHHHIADITAVDPLSAESMYRSQYLWMLGYPRQAVVCRQEMDAHARRRNHPFDLAFVLTLGAQVFDYLALPSELRTRTEEAERLGRERGVPLMSEILAEVGKGVAFLRDGDFGEAATQLRDAVAGLRGIGHRIWIWYLSALHGEALALSGHPEAALSLMEESVAALEAGEEKVHLAEVLRLRGWVLLLLHRHKEAERVLLRSLEVAREQRARSWELRTAMTLSTLFADTARTAQARDLLVPVYAWFQEGFDSPDLRRARDLLKKLGYCCTLDHPPPQFKKGESRNDARTGSN